MSVSNVSLFQKNKHKSFPGFKEVSYFFLRKHISFKFVALLGPITTTK